MKDLLQNLITQIRHYLIIEDYDNGINICENAISTNPDLKLIYWYLGLIYLLQENDQEAQMIWGIGLSDVDSKNEAFYIAELISVLDQEAKILAISDQNNLEKVWLIRSHLYEIDSKNLSNLIQINQLALKLRKEIKDDELFNTLIAIIKSTDSFTINDELLLFEILCQRLYQYSDYLNTSYFAAICIEKLPKFSLDIFVILQKEFLRLTTINSYENALKYAQLCYHIKPDDIIVLTNIANLYQNIGQFIESVAYAQKIAEISSKLIDKIIANYLICRAFMRAGGKWKEAQYAHHNFIELVESFLRSESQVEISCIVNICSAGINYLYFQDNPEYFHNFQKQIGEFCQPRIGNLILNESSYSPHNYIKITNNRPLKIGYISEYFRRHSIGWLSRWLFRYHNQINFEIYAYSLQQSNDDVQQFFADNCHRFWQLPSASLPDILTITEQITKDEIDILVDLDSLTSYKIYVVMSLKPAPIQVTWLGCDASENPAIDYFIADPFVLPKTAQDYYGTKIWRLPQTYIAVDGFETDIPTLRRSHLNISNDAIVYLNCQTNPKRNPENIKLQMEILKAVPNSYFLIKDSGGDKLAVIRFFEQIAEQVGISLERLRFLPDAPTEFIHRANLRIADVVLDSYPYSGATTTLETLWMGIPLVTKVGEQFAARNSYTMMMNLGLQEGIAWTDEEYIEWGIRYGTDPNLRAKVSWQLLQSRKTSLLWNAKEFTKQMESAYQQMWKIYVDSLSL